MSATIASETTRTTTGTRKFGVISGAALGMVFGFSAAYVSTLSLFLKPIAVEFGWSRAQISGVAMLAQLGLAIGTPLLGGLINRHGAHKVIPISVVLFAAGLLGLAQSPNSLILFGVCSLLLGIAAVGTTPAGYLTALPGFFDRRLGLAMGFAMFGLGLGNTLMPLVTGNWVSDLGWRGAYAALAMTVLVGGAAAVALLYGPTILGLDRSSKALGAGDQTLPGDDLSLAIRTPRFWIIAAILFMISGAVIGAIVHMVSALTDRGVSLEMASIIAAIIGIGVMIGRVGVGMLLDAFDARYLAAIAFTIGAVGLGLIAANSSMSVWLVGVSAFLFAFAIGAEGDFMPFFVRRYFGLKQFSLIYGVQFFFFAIGGVFGPVLFGLGFDRFGDYTIPFWGASLICVIAAVLSITLGDYKYASSDIRH